nr:unnamed protein product [Digitaria exilis]
MRLTAAHHRTGSLEDVEATLRDSVVVTKRGRAGSGRLLLAVLLTVDGGSRFLRQARGVSCSRFALDRRQLAFLHCPGSRHRLPLCALSWTASSRMALSARLKVVPVLLLEDGVDVVVLVARASRMVEWMREKSRCFGGGFTRADDTGNGSLSRWTCCD